MMYTPGPWKAEGKWPSNIRSKDKAMIATVWNVGEEVTPYNARLIAAAPEMLAALEALESLAKNPNHRTARTQLQMCSFFDDIVLPITDKALAAVAAGESE